MSEHPAHSGHEYGGGYARAADLASGDPDWMSASGGQREYDDRLRSSAGDRRATQILNRFQSAINLLYPDDMTPDAKRILESIIAAERPTDSSTQ